MIGMFQVESASRLALSNGSSRSDRNPNVGSRPRKRRPPQDSVSRQEADVEAMPTNMLITNPSINDDDEPDNSENFDSVTRDGSQGSWELEARLSPGSNITR